MHRSKVNRLDLLINQMKIAVKTMTFMEFSYFNDNFSKLNNVLQEK